MSAANTILRTPSVDPSVDADNNNVMRPQSGEGEPPAFVMDLKKKKKKQPKSEAANAPANAPAADNASTESVESAVPNAMLLSYDDLLTRAFQSLATKKLPRAVAVGGKTTPAAKPVPTASAAKPTARISAAGIVSTPAPVANETGSGTGTGSGSGDGSSGGSGSGSGSGTVTVALPTPIMNRIPKKTVWANIESTAKALNREMSHLQQFVLTELGTVGSVDAKQQLIIKGTYRPPQVVSLLKHYAKEYVMCRNCLSANSALAKDPVSRLWFVTCNVCQTKRSVAAIKAGFISVTRDDRKAARQQTQQSK